MNFQVYKLGKIEKATFDIKNLTIFVGKNSTNKSYVAHIVYILNKILSKFNNENLYNRGGVFKKFLIKYLDTNKNLLEEIKKLEKKGTIKKYKVEVNENIFAEEEIREVIFSLENIDIQKIIDTIAKFITSLVLDELNKSFNTNTKVLERIVLSHLNLENINLSKSKKIIIRSDEETTDHIRLIQYIFENIVNQFYLQKACSEEFYFPASRTGFVLAFDEIVSGVLRDRFGGQPTATKLTEPTIDFIARFSDIKSGKFGDEIDLFGLASFYKKDDKLKELFNFIEKRIIKGKIVEEKKEQNYTQFYLKAENLEKLDIHLTSSATIELLPLVIFLKHFSKVEDRLLVIEEPEAHLHPQAQIEMARLIVMLSNAGAKVLITTHSDYIVNEISNCIKLSKVTISKRNTYLKKYQLNEDIIINKNRVSAYLFKDKNETIEVKELEIDEYGISNENFDEVLDELLDRTEEINEILGN